MMKSQKNSGTITRLAQGKRDPTRVNVYLNHRFAFSLSAEAVITKKIVVGRELSQDEVAALTSVSDEEKIFAKVINYISFRPRSVKEVMDRLYTYIGPDEQEAKNVLIERLTRLGYLDDLAFARWFAKSRRANRPRSIRQLSDELYAKGVPKEIISQVLGEEGDDREAIRKLIIKKKKLEKDKLIAYLARRGFTWDIIREEVKNTSGE